MGVIGTVYNYKQHKNLVVGLSLKFKSLALRASVLNFNERPPIQFLSYMYKPTSRLPCILIGYATSRLLVAKFKTMGANSRFAEVSVMIF
jgi:hypothetical protein